MKVQKLSNSNTLYFKGNNDVFKINDIHGHTGPWSCDGKFYPVQTVDNLLKDTFEINLNNESKTFRVSDFFVSNLACLDKKPDGSPLMDELQGNASLLNESKDTQLLRPLLVCQPTKAGASAEKIKQLIEQNPGRVFGFKFHPELGKTAQETAKAIELYKPYMQLAQEFKLPCVFHSGVVGSTADPWKIYELAKQTPKVPVILYHMSLAPFGQVKDLSFEERARRGLLGQENKYIWEVRESWNNEGIAVAKTAQKNGDANLFVETSWTKPETGAYAVKELGAERVLYGSDAPLGDFMNRDFYRQNLSDSVKAIANSFSKNTDDILKKVFFENSQNLFIRKNWTEQIAQKGKDFVPELKRVLLAGAESAAAIAAIILEHPPKI